MCIIIDANTVHDFARESLDSKPVLKRIAKGSLRIVCGGKLKVEWHKAKLTNLYRQLLLSGKLKEYSDAQTNLALAALNLKTLKSDDPHVIALAIVSGARILYSRDKNLHDDFKNPVCLPGAKGKIYQNQTHEHVLDETVCHCH